MPMSISTRLGSPSESSPPFVIMVRGVAVVTASAPLSSHKRGFIHVVMAVGNETMRMILPVIAGLTKFWPIPPKSCFTTTIAMTEPIAACHSGIDTGRLKASRSPVTTALRSPSVLLRFMILRDRYSESMHVPIVTRQMSRTRGPKSQTDAARAGISAIITLSIIPLTV